MVTHLRRGFQEYLDELRRQQRIAQGLPPDPPAPLLSPLGPLAVPTGTEEKPPSRPPNLMAPFGRGTGRVEGERELVGPKGKSTPAPPTLIEWLAGRLIREDVPARGIFKALTTPVMLEQLQAGGPIAALMGLPVGAPVGSLVGTAGRGVLTQTGAAAKATLGRAIETGGVSAGMPKAAETVAARARPKTPGVSRPGQAEMPITPSVAPEALGPAVKAAQATEGVTGNVLKAAFHNLGVSQRNAVEQRRFLQEKIIPAFMAKFGDAPVMSIRNRTLGGKEPLLEVHTAGWESRLKELGLTKVSSEGFADQYSLEGLPRRMLTAGGQAEMPVGARVVALPEAPPGTLFIPEGFEIEKVFPVSKTVRLINRATGERQTARNLSPNVLRQAREQLATPQAAALPEAVAPRVAKPVPPVAERALPVRGPMEPIRQELPQAAAGQALPPTGAAAPPIKPPIEPPVVPGGMSPTGPNIPSYVAPPMMGKNVLGMKPIQAGLSKSEEIANIARRTVGKVGIRLVEDNPLVSGAFKERSRLKSVADSQSGRLATKHSASLGRAFKFDKQGRVADLASVDSTLPGAPTIQDVAARLPRYWDSLSAEQQQAMLALRRDVTPYRSLLDEVGVEVPARADVIEGGFYLPRGRADVEGADLPLKVGTGLGRGGQKGFERPAVFESQAAGIDAGYEYPPIADTLAAYARDAGNRATDAHIATFFKTATDETGQLLGNTPKMRLMQENPAVATKMQALKDSLDRLKRLSASLTNRQLEVIDKWQRDPTFDDLDVLLDGLKTMRGGRGAGMTAPEMQTALTATRQAIRALAPEYKVARRRAQATPRTEGAVGLPGMQGWAFPDEIANAANLILRGEGPPTGLAAKPVAVANAFNNLYRGAKATMDNSAIGIQGLLGAADDPVTYAKAVGVNLRAWGPGGEAALGRYIGQFDEAATKAGRLTSDDWARANLRIGGAQTEFQLGAGVSEKLSRLPVVRQANRAFGYFGDALRLDWADDMLAAELRRGKSIQELWDAGDVQRIADIANNMTGWAQGKAFGSMGDLLLFAPRFLESRAETIVKGVAGLRPGASIEQRAARRSLLKMMGYGALITVAANEMLGNETDFRPIIKVRRGNDWQYTWNPNFMRVRFAGRDWSIYGTWDSFARAITVTAMGRPQEALRGLGSGTLTAAWDIISTRDFEGEPVRNTPVHFGKWLLESMLPFSAPQTTSIAREGIGAVQAGDVRQAAGAVITTGLSLQGAKSSPLTLKDRLGIADEEFAVYLDIPSKNEEREAKLAASKTPTERLRYRVSRNDYRAAYPEIDAKLFITGQTTSFQSEAAKRLAVHLMREAGIRVKDIQSLQPEEYETTARKQLRNYFKLALGESTPLKYTYTPPSPADNQWIRTGAR